MHIYGTNLVLAMTGGGFEVQGLLQDGQPINAHGLLGGQASVFVHNIPEPASLSLAALGAVILKRAGSRAAG
jgi:hypothetical protein